VVKVLIVTLNNLKFQWANEGMNKLGVSPQKIVVCTMERQKGLEDIPYIISQDLTADAVKNADWIVISYSNIGQYPK
jgi:hypothetical protein